MARFGFERKFHDLNYFPLALSSKICRIFFPILFF